jgi:very-short-patch-repair endonuclease
LDALAAADACVPEGLPFGDAEATRARIIDVLETLGFDASRIDPDTLTGRGTTAAGVHNVAVAFRGPSNHATRALGEELAALRQRNDWQHTAARWLVESPRGADDTGTGQAPSGLAAGLPPVTVRSLQLNDSQEQAVLAAGKSPVTVVTGPPGTGKSQLVAAVVANQWLAGRSVLVASTNNKAVDVAVDRCETIDPALLVRTGNREKRDALPSLLEQLTGRGATPGPSRNVIRRQLEAAAAGREAVHRRLADRTATESALAQQILDVEALRTMLWGAPAPGPVHHQRAALRRAAHTLRRSRWFRGRRARRLLAAAQPTRPAVRVEDVVAWADAEVRADELIARVSALGPADPVRDREELAAVTTAWTEAGTTALLDTVQQQLHHGHGALQQLSHLRAAARTARAAAIARTFPYVPGWACTTLAAQANFPLQAGLFDLLVIDEASQCSVADVLPLAYRARRILVVGDPNQLTPVVTLGRAAIHGIARTAGTTHVQMRAAAVSIGDDSAFTAYVARSAGAPHLLEEHYRCHPEIARFFNEQFYAGSLRILTDVTGPTSPRGLSFVDVPGSTRRGETGGAYNVDEADAVVAWVLEHGDEPGTLGVVTPFAAQARLIDDRLRAALGAETYEAREVAVGTAHRFQGGERDVVLFSVVLAGAASPGTARWVELQRNLVNVAVSRARRALVVFGDKVALAGTPVPTLHALVRMASGEDAPIPLEQPLNDLHEVAALHSEAERRLYAALCRAGVSARLKPVVEGYELDFAVDTPAGPVNVEVDGVHHTDDRGRQRRQDLARDKILESLGWRVLRVPAWQCLSRPEQTAAALVRQLGQAYI